MTTWCHVFLVGCVFRTVQRIGLLKKNLRHREGVLL